MTLRSPGFPDEEKEALEALVEAGVREVRFERPASGGGQRLVATKDALANVRRSREAWEAARRNNGR